MRDVFSFFFYYHLFFDLKKAFRPWPRRFLLITYCVLNFQGRIDPRPSHRHPGRSLTKRPEFEETVDYEIKL